MSPSLASSNPKATSSAAEARQEVHARRNKKDEEVVNKVLGIIIFVLLFLLLRDVWTVQSISRRMEGRKRYIQAVRSSEKNWKIGWQIEEIESQIITQKRWLKRLNAELTSRGPLSSFFHLSRGGGGGAAGAKKGKDNKERKKKKEDWDERAWEADLELLNHLRTHVLNRSSLTTWTCATRPDSPIRVGSSDFFDSVSENCMLHSAGRHSLSPASIFDVVDLDDGFVGFRALSNGKFIKMIPPKSGKSGDPFTFETTSPIPGIAERFRISKEGFLFNEMLQGYVKCPKGNSAELPQYIQGVVGTNLPKADDQNYIFNFHPLTEEEIDQALVMKKFSQELAKREEDEVKTFLADSKIKLDYESLMAKEELKRKGATIALLIPVTSKDTTMTSVAESPFFQNTFVSFMESINWETNRYKFVFWLGYDRADALYDTGDAWTEMRKAFKGYMEEYIDYMNLSDELAVQIPKQLSIKLMHFDDEKGRPSQVVSHLALAAYEAGADYFYQVNDDTVFKSKDWAHVFMTTLAESPLVANFGVTGPFDTTNPRILTHAFIHRTHIEIFGFFFPEAFHNWWSDDYISSVYGRLHTFREHGVTIQHNIHDGKKGNTIQRYKVDDAAQHALRGEVLYGMVQLNAFLASKGRPRIPLPDICGYIPLVEEVAAHLKETADGTSSRPPQVPSDHDDGSAREEGDGQEEEEEGWRSRSRRNSERKKEYEIQKFHEGKGDGGGGGGGGVAGKKARDLAESFQLADDDFIMIYER